MARAPAKAPANRRLPRTSRVRSAEVDRLVALKSLRTRAKTAVLGNVSGTEWIKDARRVLAGAATAVPSTITREEFDLLVQAVDDTIAAIDVPPRRRQTK